MVARRFRRRTFMAAAAGFFGSGLASAGNATAQAPRSGADQLATPSDPGSADFGGNFLPPFADAQPRPLLSKLNEVYSVLDFGAKGDGESDDTAAIERAYSALPLSGGVLFLPPGRSFKVRQVNLPLNRPVWTWGYGARVLATSETPAFRRMPREQGEAQRAVAHNCSFYGLAFIGNGTPNQMALQIGATYNSVIQDCSFSGLDTAVDLQFCLMASVRSCMAASNATDSFIARHGDWPGATTSNAQSNHTVFQSCRVHSAQGSQAAFKLRASSGIGIYDCITEGRNTINNIDFDYAGSTTTRLFTIRNLHSENVPENAIIKCAGAGIVTVDGVYFQLPTILIDSSGSQPATIFHLSRVPYWPIARPTTQNLLNTNNLMSWPRAKLKADPGTGAWIHWDMIPGIDLRDSANWVDGAAPRNLIQILAGARR